MKRIALIALLWLGAIGGSAAYPLDGYEYSGIKRLEFYRLVAEGKLKGPVYPSGQHLALDLVQPRWRGTAEMPAANAEFSRTIASLVDGDARPHYGLAVLDLSNPDQPRYGGHNLDLHANVGSVGKIVVALAVFQKLAEIYPKDIAARERVLRQSEVIADQFSQHDHHKVPVYDIQAQKRTLRQVRVGDRASLWEYLDWMISASSNSAAGMVQKELIALSHFGARYPVAAEEKKKFFKETSRAELGRLLMEAQDQAIIRNGLDLKKLRQGSLFTRGGNRLVASSGGSYATPGELVHYMLRLEAGKLVDEFSSRELKRLMYSTQRRIRYASHPVLDDAAVYFKSGSFFQCHAGPSKCVKYKGDKTNRLASIAIIESPAGQPRLHYVVALVSNVLHVNSAVAHQTLAMRIHRLIETAHPKPELAPDPADPSAYPVIPVDRPDE